MEVDIDIFPENMGHTMVLGKTGSGKSFLMNVIMERCIPGKIEIADIADFKLPKNKGKEKRRGKK